LIQAFQEVEDLPDARIWGGSNLAAGSDSELGSSLHWTAIRDIAEALIEKASSEHLKEAPGVVRSQFGILVVMDPAEAMRLHGLLDVCGAEVFMASSCAEARRTLQGGAPIRAIFSSQRLPDGGFGDLVQMAGASAEPLPVIVFLPKIDGGWIDLLEAGAFDLVVEPYRRETIERVIGELSLYRGAPSVRVPN
jgi:hypothetical protein